MFNKLKSQRTLVNSTLNLSTLNQNILYLTRQADAILKRVDILIDDINLQQQANAYYTSYPTTHPRDDAPDEDNPIHPEDEKDLD